MREIKFRGKRPSTGKWHVGDIRRFEDSVYVADSTGAVYDVDPATMGQYTGVKDKNGSEIYEGDIVKQLFEVYHEATEYSDGISLEGTEIGPVVITASKGVCLKRPMQQGEEDGEEFSRRVNAYKSVAAYRSEVIGNLWDNPELLEVSKCTAPQNR